MLQQSDLIRRVISLLKDVCNCSLPSANFSNL